MTQNVLGIDLGTANTCAAIIDKATGQPVVIVNQYGTRIIPSVVALRGDQVLVGQRAKNQAALNPNGTFYGVKRLIGKSFEAVQDIVGNVPFSIVRDSSRNGAAAVEFNGEILSPQEISAHILREVKEAAETNLGETVTKAVLSVPAYFNSEQLQAIKDASQIAGLEVLRVINDPTAAALAHGMGGKKNGKIAVYHLGGGTFDISILDVNDGMFEVLATNSDSHFGGETIDDVLVEFLIGEIKLTHDVDLVALDKMSWLSALQRIRLESEKAKRALSFSMQHEINLPYLAMRDGTPVNFEYTLKRSQLEALAQRLINKTIDPCRKALNDAYIKASDIDEVILEGGMTYMPLVVETAKRVFNKAPYISVSVKADEAGAIGAAIQAGILVGNIIEYTDTELTTDGDCTTTLLDRL